MEEKVEEVIKETSVHEKEEDGSVITEGDNCSRKTM